MLALESRFNAPCANGLLVVIDKLPNELIQLRLLLLLLSLLLLTLSLRLLMTGIAAALDSDKSA